MQCVMYKTQCIMYKTQCVIYKTQCVMKFSATCHSLCSEVFLVLNMCVIKEILLYLHIGIVCKY
jgi:hypothetical protein